MMTVLAVTQDQSGRSRSQHVESSVLTGPALHQREGANISVWNAPRLSGN